MRGRIRPSADRWRQAKGADGRLGIGELGRVMLNRRRTVQTGEGGFSLIELLAGMALLSILMTIGVFSLRQFWFVRSLEGGKQEMVTQLRQLQQRVGAASAPLVYGARFTVGSGEWDLVEYDTANPGDPCELIREGTFDKEVQFDAGVVVTQADFANYGNTPAPNSNNITGDCLGGATGDIAWFFARGTATRGFVTIRQPVLDRTETICVSGLTGRVYEREGSTC